MKLLLINPRYPESFWSFRWAVREVLPEKRAVNPPLGLATIAALCPPQWQITIIDENVEPVPLDTDADVVGVCGMGVQFERQLELLAYYRGQDKYTVAGGSFASLCPEKYARLADTVIAGEAEYIWRSFCADLESGTAAGLYRETGTVRLEDSPTPRFDLLKMDRYTTATIQFSRGCPYRCEFCDIIVMFGRKPRHKSHLQVERELDALRRQGVRNVFFVDDNFIGHRSVAKSLLRFLIGYQHRYGQPFNFGTEVSINVAQDQELLGLLREAHFGWVFIGIESPDPDTLKQTLKTQNTHEDLLVSIRRIYSYGIDVLAGFIVGFDGDTPATFDIQYQFIEDSGIQAAMLGLLTALPRTPLYKRLAAEGRLRNELGSDNTKAWTNVAPKRMSYQQLVDGYRRVYQRLVSDKSIARRVRNKLRHMAPPEQQSEYTRREQLTVIARLFFKGIAAGGITRIWYFLSSMPLLSPAKLPVALVDWIAGLSMRDYVIRHFEIAGGSARKTERLLTKIVRRGRKQLRDAGTALSVTMSDIPRLTIRIDAQAGCKYLSAIAGSLRKLLAHTQAQLTLRVETLTQSEAAILERFLIRIAPYGDRICLALSDRVRNMLSIDTSVFRLALPGAAS